MGHRLLRLPPHLAQVFDRLLANGEGRLAVAGEFGNDNHLVIRPLVLCRLRWRLVLTVSLRVFWVPVPSHLVESDAATDQDQDQDGSDTVQQLVLRPWRRLILVLPASGMWFSGFGR